MTYTQLTDFAVNLNDIVTFDKAEGIKILNEKAFREEAETLVRAAVFADNEQTRDAARWVIWEGARALGVYPASIQSLYEARGKNDYHGTVIPAINLRTLTYDTARMIFRAMTGMNGGPVILEIAKSEMGYTFQRPAEYSACILAAALVEGYTGPVFIQGDHFQTKAAMWKENPQAEEKVIADLIHEAVEGGFYNIDIDTSTLVELDHDSLDEQQRHNYEGCARLTEVIRQVQPDGVEVSIGGEIGEVGKQNSTIEELDAFMGGYLKTLKPGLKGISKISIQTGTSHGGVPMADGSVAEVALDFGCLESLGKHGREKYGISGTVQHGASTLPDEAFHKFAEAEAVEVHLATGFQNLVMDHPKLDPKMVTRYKAYLDVYSAKDRKEGWTDEQFYYKTRKNALGPFKADWWCAEGKEAILEDLYKKFAFLFDQLGCKDASKLFKLVTSKPVVKPMPDFLHKAIWPEAVKLVKGVTAADFED